jgi:predicted DNA-binding transcriptional regulator YafY
MPRGNQLVRQWQLLQFLARPGGLTVADAAGQLGCTVRTVWRDLRVLQDANFPIYDDRDNGHGRHGVWRVDRSFQDRAPLSLPELVALLMSRDLLGPAGASPLGPAVASVFAKIRALLSARALEVIDRMRATVGVRALGAKLQAPVYLVFGQWAHVGKGATFGLGRYRLEAAGGGSQPPERGW